jgi:hypothetical protein
MQLRPLLVAVLALAAVTVLAACGEEKETTFGKTEGAYVTAGEIEYQVQISRQLNPALEEDAGYFGGVTESDKILEPDTDFFGVFIKAWNKTDEPHPTATNFEVRDTAGNIYKPLSVGPDNALAYRPGVLEGGGQLPSAEDLASFGPTQGAMLLFKVAIPSFDNRPLVLVIRNPENPEEFAQVDLDV